MQTPHTPLPWRLLGRENSNIIAPSGQVLAVVDKANPLPWNANAAFIVRAVNSHDELVAVVSELAVWEADPNRYGGDLADLGQRASALLSRLSV